MEENYKWNNLELKALYDDLTNGLSVSIDPEFIRKCNEAINKCRVRKKIYMMTVCCKDGTDYKLFRKLINKWLTKVWVMEPYGCIEWRGEDIGMHFHCEFVLKKKKFPSEMIKETYSTFKKVCEKQCIKVISNYHGYKNYVNGFKKGLRKKYYKYDLLMRKKYKCLDIIVGSGL